MLRRFSATRNHLLAATVIAGLGAIVAGTADASIVQPNQEVDVAALLEELALRGQNGQGGMSSGAAPSDSSKSQESASYEELASLSLELRSELPSDAAPSGSSSSTASSGSGASSSAVQSAAISLTHDGAIVGRVAGERALTLPAPMGSDLLRPPQA